MQNSKIESPWYIKFLLAFSGWIGAILITIAIGLFFGNTIHIEEKSLPYIFIPLGALLTTFALKSLQNIDSEFKEHFLLAISFVGQILIIVSISILFGYKNYTTIYLLSAIFQAALMWIAPHYLHRALNAFLLATFLGLLFFKLGVPWLSGYLLIASVVYLFVNRFYLKPAKKYQSIAYGLLFALLLSMYNSTTYIYGIHAYYRKKIEFIELPLYIDFALFSMISAYVAYSILKAYGSLDNKRVLFLTLFSALVVGLISIKVKGVAIGVILITLGFFISNRLLQGIGILLMIIFASRYYYSLNETLLYKSLILLILGVLLLAFRFIFKKIVEVEK